MFGFYNPGSPMAVTKQLLWLTPVLQGTPDHLAEYAGLAWLGLGLTQTARLGKLLNFAQPIFYP